MLTVEQLHNSVRRYNLSSRSARKNLTEVIGWLTELLNETSDAKRVRTFNKFKKCFSGYGNLEQLADWSALANPSAETLQGQVEVKATHKQIADDRAVMNRELAAILQEGTGITAELAHKITCARYLSKSFLETWPVTEETSELWAMKHKVVTGPLGKMPLDGPGSPYWISGDRERNAR